MAGNIVPEACRRSKRAVLAAAILIGLHAVLLVSSLPDYFADNDLGFHISLGRQYGEHGTYFWDYLNWAPSGRPNLQGPLLHLSIGGIGRLLGGDGDDYVLAFSILALLQWAAAVFTTFWFSRRWGGDWAALFATALVTGSIWSAGPFLVGVPSGWIFVLTPWAVFFFLQKRYGLSILMTTAVIYVHLGGTPVAPFGIFLAAVFTRDWSGLAKVGTACAVLSSPFLIHFFEHLDWYNGQRGHVAGEFAVLTYLLAVPGLVLLLKRPREHLFLLIWAVAPVAWFFQDNLRFFLQSTPVASTIGGLFLVWLIHRTTPQRLQAAAAIVIVVLATVFPFSIPSLPVEAAWALGHGFPRELDWNEVRVLAEVMEESGEGGRIVNSYYDSLSAAMAVYSPLRQEFGHWGEVRPSRNPAEDVSAGEKLYVLPLPPEDRVLQSFEREDRIKVLGGSQRTALVVLTVPGLHEQLGPQVAGIVREECEWLYSSAVNNRMPPAGDLLYPERIEEFRRITTEQRNHVGRIQVALLILAFSYEREDPSFARDVRNGARGWGSIANFIGDETAMNYLGEDRFRRFLENCIIWSDLVVGWSEQTVSIDQVDEASDRLFDDFFG